MDDQATCESPFRPVAEQDIQEALTLFTNDSTLEAGPTDHAGEGL